MELFNKMGKQNVGKAFSVKDFPMGDPFVYKHLGSMATVGRYKALVDLRQSKVSLEVIIFALFFKEVTIFGLTCNIVLAGRQRHIPCWVCQLVDLEISLPYSCCELEKQVLCGSELGNHVCVWQR